MSIASAIQAKQQQIADSYSAVSDKGGTLPTTQNLTNLATAISSIPSGGGICIPREVKNGVFQMPTEKFTFSLPSDATDVGRNALQNAFQNCTGLTSVDLSSLTTVTGYSALGAAFSNCPELTDVYFRALTTKSFGSKKNQFINMLKYTESSKTHTLHFPSNMQSTISGLDGYPLFGGTSGYVVCAFDLPATS